MQSLRQQVELFHHGVSVIFCRLLNRSTRKLSPDCVGAAAA